jgi:hypothetical protein
MPISPGSLPESRPAVVWWLLADRDVGGHQQLGYAVLDALGEHVKVGVGREVAGDPEGDVTAVAGKPRGSGSQGRSSCML